MANCKDCLHLEVCELAHPTGSCVCTEFKDRSQYVEVVHGRWLNWRGEPSANDCWNEHICSNCNCALYFDESVSVEEFASNYCPNCGAKMDGERREGE